MSLSAARAELGDLALKAQYVGQVTVLTRKGKPVAALVPLPMLPDEETESEA